MTLGKTIIFFWSQLSGRTQPGSISNQHLLEKSVAPEGPEGSTHHSINSKDWLLIPVLLTFIYVWLPHVSTRKQIGWDPWSPLRNLRTSKHFKTGDLAKSLCTFSMHNKDRVRESTYFSTKMSGFIRVSCSRKAKGNKTQSNTNKDSHYQPFKYTEHTLVVYTEKRKCTFLHISVNQHSHPLRPFINHLVVRQPHIQGVHPSSLLELL